VLSLREFQSVLARIGRDARRLEARCGLVRVLPDPAPDLGDARAFYGRVGRPLSGITQEFEVAALTYALRAANGRMERAAKRLGLSRKGLYLKRQRLGLQPPEPQD
jgi:DNA-binding NtrC family response regulator